MCQLRYTAIHITYNDSLIFCDEMFSGSYCGMLFLQYWSKKHGLSIFLGQARAKPSPFVRIASHLAQNLGWRNPKVEWEKYKGPEKLHIDKFHSTATDANMYVILRVVLREAWCL